MRLAIVTLLLTLGLGIAFGQAQQSDQKETHSKPSEQSEGERLFEVNCGRCHRPPDQISPKVAGSVLRHMRVRANLSQEDEQKILKYLAP
jgi:cytochrome c5